MLTAGNALIAFSIMLGLGIFAALGCNIHLAVNEVRAVHDLSKKKPRGGKVANKAVYHANFMLNSAPP